jgi:hypothetical protein
MKLPSSSVRGVARAIRIIAWLSAVAALPFVIVVMLILMADGNVAEIFRSLKRWFRMLYSGHALRPFILRTISRGTCSPRSVRENHDT